MKIVQIFPGKVWGGAEQYVLDLGAAIMATGHEVSYVARPSKAVTSRLSGVVDYVLAPMGGLFDRRSARMLAPLVMDADVVHVHDAAQVSAVMDAIDLSGSKARVVLTRHIARASRTMPWRRGAMKRLHRMIFVSNLGRNLWQSVNPWMSDDKCVTIHNSIPDGPVAQPENLRERFGVDDKVPLIMFTGRVRKSKGCKTLVRSLGKVRDLSWMMLFVGTCKPADYDKELIETARECGIADRIGFYGFSDNVRSLITQASVGVAPSIVREACPLSPMEFMQAGVCVIASDNGAQPEYITNGETGLLVAPGDVDGLAASLRDVLSDYKLRRRLAAAGNAYFEKSMSYPGFLRSILKAYGMDPCSLP